jgi:hypothetical protein
MVTNNMSLDNGDCLKVIGEWWHKITYNWEMVTNNKLLDNDDK